jgi:hypothetical protein
MRTDSVGRWMGREEVEKVNGRAGLGMAGASATSPTVNNMRHAVPGNCTRFDGEMQPLAVVHAEWLRT